ncbi:MAG TPA: histidine kinase [Acidimicrobiia bacterium]|jgi:signal transduction histidine kinase|nr:histidine kinase [Acidimicrobiia bacterium]
MSTIAHRIDEPDATATVARAPAGVVAGALALAAVASVIGVLGASDRNTRLATCGAAMVIAWALTTVILALRKPHEWLWIWTGAAALVGGIALKSDNAVGLVPLAAGAVAMVLPDGTLSTKSARITFGVAAVVGVPCAVALGASDSPSATLLAVEAVVLGLLALMVYVGRCRAAGAVERARLQWAGWGAVVSGAVALVIWLMHELIGWPDALGAPIVVATAFVPLALALSSVDRIVMRIDRLLVRTIEAGGLVTLVGVVYLIVVLGFGETPNDDSRRVLGLSMVAAAIAALLFVPTRNWLEEVANRRVYGERRAPDEPIQTFGARMSRAIPLDELLLQLAESLKKSMNLAAAEVWTGTDGLFGLAASVPYRDEEHIRLQEEEVVVIARAHVSGNAWIQVWLPAVLAQHRGRTLRVAPLTHSGELLGLIVCARGAEQQPFTDEEERVLTELARQVALALHNSALDTALQASLDDLRLANEELRASRSRIVAAADQSRRQIERNLHDGAQQHLVALAVKLGLARQLVDSDPATLATLLEELRGDAQTTLTELRELAHGIYPPLLMDRGLREALTAAANRSVLETEVEAEVGRYLPEIEAAIYFCCLEAMQNAGKHAGEGSHVKLTVEEQPDHMLHFDVVDDGAGFDATSSVIHGHGFVNMADRLGAIGGKLDVQSAPGKGTRISGRIPLAVQVPDRPSQS